MSAPDPLTLAREALATTPSGLLTDLDGTLAQIVDDPGAVRLVEGAAEALAALAARIEVVGIVTGRAAADARQIVGIPRLLIVGNHGLEWLSSVSGAPERSDESTELVAELDRLLASLPLEHGVSADHKGLSATVHYRNAPDPAGARRRILTALEATPHPAVELRHGRRSIELRPRGMGDKGSAVRQVVARHGLRGLVVMGDDVTDLDMFRAAAGLRATARLHAAVIAVGAGDEVPSEVAAAADSTVASPVEAVALLAALAREPGG